MCSPACGHKPDTVTLRTMTTSQTSESYHDSSKPGSMGTTSQYSLDQPTLAYADSAPSYDSKPWHEHDERGLPPRRDKYRYKILHAIKKTPRFVFEFVFGGRHFCFCIPTRFGVVVGSFLQFLVALALAIILWFEVSTQHDFTFSNFDRNMFIGAGVLESLLFVAAVLGFVGALVRKQLFVATYCAFLYIHFLANVGVASWVTWKINHVTNTDIRVGCGEGLRNPGTQETCAHLLGDFGKVIVWILWVVILIEFYGLLIVTRYTRQLRTEKRHGRESWHRGSYTSLHSRHQSYPVAAQADNEKFAAEDAARWSRKSYGSSRSGSGSGSPVPSGYNVSADPMSGATYFPRTPQGLPMRAVVEHADAPLRMPSPPTSPRAQAKVDQEGEALRKTWKGWFGRNENIYG